MVNNAQEVMAERGNREMLEENIQKSMIRHATQYMVSTFGLHPDKHQKEQTANAVLSLFPYLAKKSSQTGGMVSTYLVQLHFRLNIAK